MVSQLIFMVEVLSAAFIAWLGLYVVTRDLPWRESGSRRYFRTGVLAGNALILLSIYLYGIALESIAQSPSEFLRLQQSTWWGIPIAAVFFLWTTMLLTHLGEGRAWTRIFYIVSFGYALFLAIGIASGFMLNANGIEARSSLFQPYYTPMQEPFIHFLHPFVLGSLTAAFILLLMRYLRTPRNTPEHQGATWLCLGSVFLLFGAVASFVLPPLDLAYAPKQVGDYVATAGAAIISLGIARHNALEQEQILQHDFWHSLITVAVSVGIYVLGYAAFSLFYGYPISPMAVIALSVLAVITQTPYNWSGAVFDRILLPRWVVAYRSRLVLMRQQPLTAVNPGQLLDEAQESFGDLIRTVRRDEIDELVRDEVEHIFQYTRFDNAEVLEASRLQQLQLVQQKEAAYASEQRLPPDGLSADQKAESLRLFLEEAIDEWMNCDGVDVSSPQTIEQVILQKKYIEGWTRTQVERYLYDQHHLAVTGGAYSRHLKQARRRLAGAIADREVAHMTMLG